MPQLLASPLESPVPPRRGFRFFCYSGGQPGFEPSLPSSILAPRAGYRLQSDEICFAWTADHDPMSTSALGPFSEIAPQKSKIRQFIDGTSTRCIPASRMVVPILRFRCAGGGQRKCTRSAPVDGQGQRLLRGRPDGIFINPFEIGAIGPDLFRAACNLGLEGLVSKRSDRPYRGGRSTHWIKVKNCAHPGRARVKEAFR